MEKKIRKTLVSTVAAGAIIGAAGLFASCDFSSKEMGTGSEVRNNLSEKAMPDTMGKMENKCGADSTKTAEGKCGEAKCGEKKKTTEGKCGEAKCGEKK